jgi:hypothetical protein
MEWRTSHQAEWTIVSRSEMGLYAVDVARSVASVAGRVATYSCSVCRQPVSPNRAPRSGEAVYCRTPECVREKNRRNQASRRATQKGRDK